jgi:molybdopterin-guanine dinucleotide biosynthesis protein A
VSLVAGIFVGGAGRRMGGRPKGLLKAPDGVTLVERWRALLDAMSVPVVLVGEVDAYAALGLPSIGDEPRGIGPLGGLIALLRHARNGPAIALACDMPFVPGTLVERLRVAPDAPIVAPRNEGRWEPLCARYDPVRVLPLALGCVARSHHSLQRLLDEARAAELPVSVQERSLLRDWDVPEDMVGVAPD